MLGDTQSGFPQTPSQEALRAAFLLSGLKARPHKDKPQEGPVPDGTKRAILRYQFC